MKRAVALSVAAAALTLGHAQAQQPSAEYQIPIQRNTVQNVFAQIERKDPAPTPEEIEIFRRILNRSLNAWKLDFSWQALDITSTNKPTGAWTNYLRAKKNTVDDNVITWDDSVSNTLYGVVWADALHHPVTGSPEPEGIYLKGYGVVFTITLPWDGQNPVGEPAKAAPKPLSEWEKVRKELHGEKAEPEKKETAKTPALAETVLKVLAENGRHFAQMTGNERVTVAITLRPLPESDVRRAAANALGQMGSSAALSNTLFRSLMTTGTTTDQGLAQKQQRDKDIASKKQEALNYVRLGDLRTNEKRYREAADAYHQAGRTYEQMLQLRRLPGSSIQDYLADVSATCDVYNKLAQTYYSLGESDKAQKILQGVTKAYERFNPKAAPQQNKAPAKTPLPGKLTVSATKQVLDQVGAGKMSFEEFRKAATVEYTPTTGTNQPAANKP